jgi:hypothetical protein
MLPRVIGHLESRMRRKYPGRCGRGPGEKAETSDLACGLPYPAIPSSSCLAISRLCPYPFHRRLQFGLKSTMAPELLAHIVQQRSRLLDFTQEAQQFSA